MLILLPLLFIVFQSALASICQTKCSCAFNDLTPFIDCSSRNLSLGDFQWSEIPLEKVKLKTLDVDLENNDFNAIENIPKIPVERLSFKANNVSSIADGAFELLAYLSLLDLSHNRLSQLSKEAFRGSKRVGQGTPSPILSLDLSFNQIQTLSTTTFEYLIHLEEINLSGNPLHLVKSSSTIQAVGSLTKLLTLNLSQTNLETIPNHFFKRLISIKTLDLSKNNLDSVPKEIHYGSGASLETLILDENPMARIKTHAFNEMSELKLLSICKMPNLAVIDEEAFAGLRNLTTLRIASNPMLGFVDPEAFVDCTSNLENLDFSKNFLRYLPKNLFNTSSLKTLNVIGNQWVCDCHNKWFIDLLNNDKFLPMAKATSCTRPSKLKGFNFIEAKSFEEDWPCSEKFDASRLDFGLDHPYPNYNSGEYRVVATTIAIGCILAILASIAFVSILYIKQQRRIAYNRLSSFKIHFQRRRQQSEPSSLSNPVYRDNPTTLPIE